MHQHSNNVIHKNVDTHFQKKGFCDNKEVTINILAASQYEEFQV